MAALLCLWFWEFVIVTRGLLRNVLFSIRLVWSQIYEIYIYIHFASSAHTHIIFQFCLLFFIALYYLQCDWLDANVQMPSSLFQNDRVLLRNRYRIGIYTHIYRSAGAFESTRSHSSYFIAWVTHWYIHSWSLLLRVYDWKAFNDKQIDCLINYYYYYDYCNFIAFHGNNVYWNNKSIKIYAYTSIDWLLCLSTRHHGYIWVWVCVCLCKIECRRHREQPQQHRKYQSEKQ